MRPNPTPTSGLVSPTRTGVRAERRLSRARRALPPQAASRICSLCGESEAASHLLVLAARGFGRGGLVFLVAAAWSVLVMLPWTRLEFDMQCLPLVLLLADGQWVMGGSGGRKGLEGQLELDDLYAGDTHSHGQRYCLFPPSSASHSDSCSDSLWIWQQQYYSQDRHLKELRA